MNIQTLNVHYEKCIHAAFSSPPHVLQIGEDKCLLLVEATGDDVLGILVSQPVGLIDAQVLPEKLFVISHLYH